MNMNPLGRVFVPTAGTPVSLGVPGVRAAKVLFHSIPGCTGNLYIGKKDMKKATMEGVVALFAPRIGGSGTDSFLMDTADGTDSLYPNDYYVDADVSGEGLLVTYWQV